LIGFLCHLDNCHFGQEIHYVILSLLNKWKFCKLVNAKKCQQFEDKNHLLFCIPVLPRKEQKICKNKSEGVNNCSHRRKFLKEPRNYVSNGRSIFEASFFSRTFGWNDPSPNHLFDLRALCNFYSMATPLTDKNFIWKGGCHELTPWPII